MIGAIIGDIAGSRFEFNNTFRKNFEIFHESCSYTDDTICTIAIASAILKGEPFADEMLRWCNKYPHPMGAYGASFVRWLNGDTNYLPYNSFGNGAAMRVSPCGFMGNYLEVKETSIASATFTHNHEYGIIGSECVAQLIFLARNGKLNTNNIVDEASKFYCMDLMPIGFFKLGKFNETCQYCVPLAIRIIEKSTSFEDAIRNAVAFGGDSDTLAAIVGSIAEHIFGIPTEMKEKALSYLPDEMVNVITKFYNTYEN